MIVHHSSLSSSFWHLFTHIITQSSNVFQLLWQTSFKYVWPCIINQVNNGTNRCKNNRCIFLELHQITLYMFRALLCPSSGDKKTRLVNSSCEATCNIGRENLGCIDLYVNVPTQETLYLTETQLKKNNDNHTTLQIMTLLNTILQQNYFSFCDQIYQPDKGWPWAPLFQALWQRYSYNTLQKPT
jgi:hypothetical protein